MPNILTFPAMLLLSVTAFAQTVPAPGVAPITDQKSAVASIPLSTITAASIAGRKDKYTFTVGGSDWLDTKVTLLDGDQVSFAATGSVTLSDGRTVTPAGVARGWKDMIRSFSDTGADVGALIGRVGSSDATVPFTIGATKDLGVAASGDLFLRINTSSDVTTTGTYSVTVSIAKAAAGKQTAPPPDLTKLVSPALFNDIPRRVQDQAGDPGDMVNFAIVGTEEQVKKAFTDAGWVAVDKSDKAAVLNGLLQTLQHQAYTSMPVSTLYLFGRSQDLSFERAAPFAVAAIRHHLRVWKSTETVDGRPLWVGSATHDNGFERDQRNNGITHHVDPNIDIERDFIEQSFAASGVLAAAAYVTPANPFLTAKTATGGAIQSDGRIVLMDLRPNLQ